MSSINDYLRNRALIIGEVTRVTVAMVTVAVDTVTVAKAGGRAGIPKGISVARGLFGVARGGKVLPVSIRDNHLIVIAGNTVLLVLQ